MSSQEPTSRTRVTGVLVDADTAMGMAGFGCLAVLVVLYAVFMLAKTFWYLVPVIISAPWWVIWLWGITRRLKHIRLLHHSGIYVREDSVRGHSRSSRRTRERWVDALGVRSSRWPGHAPRKPPTSFARLPLPWRPEVAVYFDDPFYFALFGPTEATTSIVKRGTYGWSRESARDAVAAYEALVERYPRWRFHIAVRMILDSDQVSEYRIIGWPSRHGSPRATRAEAISLPT